MPAFSLSIRRTAQVATLGDASADVRELWYVLHGYGQRAERFLRAFEPIAAKERWVVAPEALSRFYLDGASGKVGASWMTSAFRESEIDDYVEYLDRVHDEARTRLGGRAVAVHVLGFSQGCATASRWVAGGRVRPDSVTLWAGAVAPEIELASLRAGLPNTRWNLIAGTEDEWMTAAQVLRERERLEAARVSTTMATFAGGHRMDADALAQLANALSPPR